MHPIYIPVQLRNRELKHHLSTNKKSTPRTAQSSNNYTALHNRPITIHTNSQAKQPRDHKVGSTGGSFWRGSKQTVWQAARAQRRRQARLQRRLRHVDRICRRCCRPCSTRRGSSLLVQCKPLLLQLQLPRLQCPKWAAPWNNGCLNYEEPKWECDTPHCLYCETLRVGFYRLRYLNWEKSDKRKFCFSIIIHAKCVSRSIRTTSFLFGLFEAELHCRYYIRSICCRFGSLNSWFSERRRNHVLEHPVKSVGC